jgi:hypothetical protein
MWSCHSVLKIFRDVTMLHVLTIWIFEALLLGQFSGDENQYRS